MSNQAVRVKFLSTVKTDAWLHQLPSANPFFKNCHFIFDQNEQNYDWLVVYEDLPRVKGERFSLCKEELKCKASNTILFTSEPSSIKTYGLPYTQQFHHIVTSQPFLALPHKNRIYSQASLFWFYGVGSENSLRYEQLLSGPNISDKNNNCSVVWSNKSQLHTTHHQRIKFLHQLRKSLPDLAVYGRGEIPLDDKAEALDKCKYHIAIENHIGKHHWTEKLADSYLGLTLPFYYGCPNISDYFPENSYISIDIFKPNESISIIKNAIKNNEYEKRISSIKRARDKLVLSYNIFEVIHKITSIEKINSHKHSNNILMSRRAANRNNFFCILTYILQKSFNRSYYFLKSFFLSLYKKF